MASPTTGYLLIILGVVLLFGELAFFTGGILAGVGTCLMLAGVACVFAFGSWDEGLTALLGVCLGGPVLAGVGFYLWPYTPMGRRMLRAAETAHTVADMAANVELDGLVGKTGRAVSPLRPAGVADFDGRRVDVLAAGVMVDAGAAVRCVEVRAGRVLVRPAEKPAAPRSQDGEFS